MLTFRDIERSVAGGTWLYDMQDQLRDYVYALSNAAFARGDADRDALGDAASVEVRQAFIKNCFLEGIGGLPESSKSLSSEITGVLNFDGYRVEKVVYQPRNGVYVTANLYVPDGITEKSAAVLFVCGHHAEGKHVAEYQVVCQYMVRAGLIVLAQDPIGQGERLSYIDRKTGEMSVGPCTEEHDYVGFQCIARGKPLARYFLHDSMRAVDYLISRPEVDPKRIGITGNSGGGTQASMMMLADRRLAAAAPATFIMNRKYYQKTGQAQDREQIWPGLTEHGIDHEDIVLSMAPKPVLLLGVIHDFFPIEATERTYLRCHRIWEALGTGGDIERFYDDSDHHYTRKMAQKSAAFFAKHLLGREIAPIDDAIVNAIDPKLLFCTSTGQVLTSIAGARTVYDENVAELSARGTVAPTAERQEAAKSFLLKQVDKNRVKVDSRFMKRWFEKDIVEDLRVEGLLWLSQEDIVCSGLFFRSRNFDGKALPVTIALWEGGCSNLSAHAEMIRKTCARGRMVVVFDATAMGLGAQRGPMGKDVLSFYGMMFKLNDDLAFLNDSVAAMRVYDLIRLVDVLEADCAFDAGGLEIYTHGRYSVYADIARFLDKRIKRAISDEPLTSYTDFVKRPVYDKSDIASVIFPRLYDYADLDELREWAGK